MKSLKSLIISVLFGIGHLALAQVVNLQSSEGGLLTMHAVVNGQQGTFLFDSGSGLSSISPQFAAKIGCHPWSQITGFRMTGQRLDMQRCDQISMRFGGKSFPPRTVGVFDIARLLPSEVGSIDGTIALDVLAGHAFTLSYGNHTLLLLSGAALAKATAGHPGMAVHIVRDAEGLALTVNLPVTTPSGTGWFEMDSGNTSSLVLVNKVLAHLFKLPSDSKEAPATVVLADGSTFTGKAEALDLILDGNLGTSYLSSHDVTVDLVHERAWVSTVPNR